MSGKRKPDIASKMEPFRKKKNTRFKYLAIILGILIGSISLELILFIIPPKHQMDNPWYIEAGGGFSPATDLPFERPPYLKWKGISRGSTALSNKGDDPYARLITFQTDMEGFRNNLDIHTADLIVIGDSYTEAGNLPEKETFVSLLGRRLDIQTRNLARAGYTASTELIVLTKYGLKCQPSTVIWQLAESNDLFGEILYQSWILAGRPPYFNFEKKERITRLNAWKCRSPIYRIISHFRKTGLKEWPFSGMFLDSRNNEHEIRFHEFPGKDHVAYRHPGWPTLAKALATGRALCKRNGIELIVLLIPMKYRVMKDYVHLTDAGVEIVRDSHEFPLEHTMSGQLEVLCKNLGIPFIDATIPLQRATAAGKIVYLPFDDHLSKEGHKIIADLIVQTLNEMS